MSFYSTALRSYPCAGWTWTVSWWWASRSAESMRKCRGMRTAKMDCPTWKRTRLVERLLRAIMQTNEPIFGREDVKLGVDLFWRLGQHVDVAERPWVFETSEFAVANDVRLSLLTVLWRSLLPLSHRLLHRFDHLQLFIELIFMTRTCTRKDIWKRGVN